MQNESKVNGISELLSFFDYDSPANTQNKLKVDVISRVVLTYDTQIIISQKTFGSTEYAVHHYMPERDYYFRGFYCDSYEEALGNLKSRF